MDRTLERQYRHFGFRKLINAFPFFPRKNLRGGLASVLA